MCRLPVALLAVGVLFPVSCAEPSRMGEERKSVLSSQPGSGQVKTELYFGFSLPGGSEISELQWRNFVAGEITPRFRDGLTIIEAYGQWVNHEGKLLREKTKLVIIVHEDTEIAARAIKAIRETYKKRFRQESVLKVSMPVKASF